MHLKLNLNLIALTYLFIPIMLFFALWFNPLVSSVSVILILLSLGIVYFKEKNDTDRFEISITKPKDVLFLLACFALIVLLCIFSGFGGIIDAEDDWRKHHFIIEQIRDKNLPARESLGNKHGVMCYYIGAYIVPALIGKLGSSPVLYDAVLILWAVTGLFITVALTYKNAKGRTTLDFLIIALIITLFTPFIEPSKLLLLLLSPDDYMSGYLWFDSFSYVVFSSNFTQLRWAFPQALPGWICTALLISNREKRSSYALILLASLCYSVFVFIGLSAIILMLSIIDIRGRRIKEYFKTESVILIIPLTVLLIYYGSSFLQPTDIDSGIGLSFINWKGHIITFVLLQLLWIPFIVLLHKTRSRDLLFCAAIHLFCSSFFILGSFNDLCIRSTIPAMFIICTLLSAFVLDRNNSALQRILVIIVVIMLFIPDGGSYIKKVLNKGIGRENRGVAFSDIDQFAQERGDFVTYQYYNWDEDGIIKYIIKQ